MQVVQPKQGLLANFTHDRHWNALVLILLNHRQQILAQHLKCHHRVSPVLRMMEELVEHLQVVGVRARDFERGVLVDLSN